MSAGIKSEGTPSSPELPQDQKQHLADVLRFFHKRTYDIAAHNMRMKRMGNIEFTLSLSDILHRAGIPRENAAVAINLLRRTFGINVYDDKSVFFTKNFIPTDPFHENFHQDRREDVPNEQVLRDAEDGNLKGRKIA